MKPLPILDFGFWIRRTETLDSALCLLGTLRARRLTVAASAGRSPSVLQSKIGNRKSKIL